ncbi:MAG: DUF4349 domain-containing protein [Pyrinomonadaceae bacterium]
MQAGGERKIIRNAELIIESRTPEDNYRKITSLLTPAAVTSSPRKRQGDDESQSKMTVTMIARVPSNNFDAVVEEVRKVGHRVIQDKRTGQDVTEEYVDIEARLRAKKAVEAQFLEIMKRAEKISDALEVQRQLGEVRAEVEQIEGRRRFLENQSSMSTITVTIRPPTAIIAGTSSGFWSGVREAISSGVGAAASIVLVLIRIVIALVPILLFIALPIGLAIRFFVRRSKRSRVS